MPGVDDGNISFDGPQALHFLDRMDDDRGRCPDLFGNFPEALPGVPIHDPNDLFIEIVNHGIFPLFYILAAYYTIVNILLYNLDNYIILLYLRYQMLISSSIVVLPKTARGTPAHFLNLFHFVWENSRVRSVGHERCGLRPHPIEERPFYRR
jgi:hypothetical protein